MAVRDRKRDFTSQTLAEIHSNLKGETQEYTDLGDFWAANGDAFDSVNVAAELKELDMYMTDIRGFMSSATPEALNTVEATIRQIDEDYAQKCNNHTAELASYGQVVDLLVAAISAPDFDSTFSLSLLSGATFPPEWGVKIGESLRDWMRRKLKERNLKDAEVDAAMQHPLAAIKVDKCQKTAEGVYSVVIETFGATIPHDGRQVNSFHHAFWSALMTCEIGAEKAELFATAHETYDAPSDYDVIAEGFTQRDHAVMDLHNNAIGRAIGAQCPPNDYAINGTLLNRLGSRKAINEARAHYGVSSDRDLVLILMCIDAYKEAVHCRVVYPPAEGKLESIPPGTDISNKLVFLGVN